MVLRDDFSKYLLAQGTKARKEEEEEASLGMLDITSLVHIFGRKNHEFLITFAVFLLFITYIAV